MYFSEKKHLLSGTLLAAAAINVGGSVLSALVRLLLRRRAQIVIAALEAAAVLFVFLRAHFTLRRCLRLFPEEEQREMGRLQEEVFGPQLSSLSVQDIRKLLELWTVIFIGPQLIHIVSGSIYRRLTGELLAYLPDGSGEASLFIAMYNSSHGFKYAVMLTALLMGVIVTGIFLDDRILRGAAGAVAAVFLLAFALVRMQTLSVFGRSIGIVWTSVIFHLAETAGLIALALYLRRRYRGV